MSYFGWYGATTGSVTTTDNLQRIKDTLREAEQWGHRYSFTNEDIKWLVAEIDRLKTPVSGPWEE